jgi:hypothetical protein
MADDVFIGFTGRVLVSDDKGNGEVMYQSSMLKYWLNLEFFANAPALKRVVRKMILENCMLNEDMEMV